MITAERARELADMEEACARSGQHTESYTCELPDALRLLADLLPSKEATANAHGCIVDDRFWRYYNEDNPCRRTVLAGVTWMNEHLGPAFDADLYGDVATACIHLSNMQAAFCLGVQHLNSILDDYADLDAVAAAFSEKTYG